MRILFAELLYLVFEKTKKLKVVIFPCEGCVTARLSSKSIVMHSDI